MAPQAKQIDDSGNEGGKAQAENFFNTARGNSERFKEQQRAQTPPPAPARLEVQAVGTYTGVTTVTGGTLQSVTGQQSAFGGVGGAACRQCFRVGRRRFAGHQFRRSFRIEQDAEDPHRTGDVLDVVFAVILELVLHAIAQMIAHAARHADAAGLGDPFEPCRDVDAVAENVAILDQDIADVDADAKQHPAFRRDRIVGLGQRLLDGAELSVGAGDRLCLVGRNGSGKSTLLKIMAGEVEDFQGEAWPADGVRVGYLPQEPDLDAAKDVLVTMRYNEQPVAFKVTCKAAKPYFYEVAELKRCLR